VKKVEKYNYTI